jgi:hypothetical protein
MSVLGHIDWSLVPFTFVGAFVLHVRCRTQKKEIFSLFQAINIGTGKGARPWVILADMVVSCCIGSIFVAAVSQPSTNQQAVISGFGMIGLFSVLSKTSTAGDRLKAAVQKKQFDQTQPSKTQRRINDEGEP